MRKRSHRETKQHFNGEKMIFIVEPKDLIYVSERFGRKHLDSKKGKRKKKQDSINLLDFFFLF